ncbi:hypothetical protein [Herbiconiux solani]|nr:hypothetical protein [Herbiconiux solani]
MRRIDKTTKTYRHGYTAGVLLGLLVITLVAIALVGCITTITRALINA